MIEAGRPSTKIAQQLRAVEGAIATTKKALIHDHIGHSLNASGVKGHAALRDFRAIANFFVMRNRLREPRTFGQ
jgi:DNA-binding FrmR family transcriptional regulator